MVTSDVLKRNALGNRTAWLRPVVKILAVSSAACMIYSLEGYI
jgi:hypothetical protein